jgi:hypothetical protein
VRLYVDRRDLNAPASAAEATCRSGFISLTKNLMMIVMAGWMPLAGH